MSWYDWLLFVHMTAAFALVGSLVFYWVIVVATRPGGELPQSLALSVTAPANILIVVGTLGTLVFGVWLSIYDDRYKLWDGWILTSLVLWAIGSEAGRRSGNEFLRAARGQADPVEARRRGVLLHTASSVAVLVILILMIFKPGA